MHEALDPQVKQLQHQFPLPASWQVPSCFSFVTNVGDLEIFLVGLVAKSCANDGDVAGSAGALGEYPVERAYFELVERAATVDALDCKAAHYPIYDTKRGLVDHQSRDVVFPPSPPDAPWTYARSNGVAVASTWEAACQASRAELVERHRVLSSWFGITRPKPIKLPKTDALHALDFAYEVFAYSFPCSEWETEAKHEVVGVFGFPRSAEAPFVYGLSAGRSSAGAIAGAAREFLQRLGFLWGENIPDREPTPEPTSAYHQELYLWPRTHDKLRRWLAGERFDRTYQTGEEHRAYSLGERFVDLTPPVLHGRLHVAKALPSGELPLTFGQGHPDLPDAGPKHSVHPIA